MRAPERAPATAATSPPPSDERSCRVASACRLLDLQVRDYGDATAAVHRTSRRAATAANPQRSRAAMRGEQLVAARRSTRRMFGSFRAPRCAGLRRSVKSWRNAETFSQALHRRDSSLAVGLLFANVIQLPQPARGDVPIVDKGQAPGHRQPFITRAFLRSLRHITSRVDARPGRVRLRPPATSPGVTCDTEFAHDRNDNCGIWN